MYIYDLSGSVFDCVNQFRACESAPNYKVRTTASIPTHKVSHTCVRMQLYIFCGMIPMVMKYTTYLLYVYVCNKLHQGVSGFDANTDFSTMSVQDTMSVSTRPS